MLVHINIICRIHGMFSQTPRKHLLGRGCRKCGVLSIKAPPSHTTPIFVENAIKKHGIEYGYSKVDYINSRTFVIITCHIHGDFNQTPSSHLSGSGCPMCYGTKKRTTLEFIKLSNEIHKYLYGYLKVLYVDANIHVIITCKIHGDFDQRPSNHLNGQGCPYCLNYIVHSGYNLEAMHPELIPEWDITNLLPMKNYFPKSGKKVKWVCLKIYNERHEWEATINSRTVMHAGCPHCRRSINYSKAQIKWLNAIENDECLTIKHALSGGEYYIQGVGYVDGYCEETNTVYEYHGDYWHGNPLVYDKNVINPTTKKTYGELFQKTIIRDKKIRELGYNLIVTWETPNLW